MHPTPPQSDVFGLVTSLAGVLSPPLISGRLAATIWPAKLSGFSLHQAPSTNVYTQLVRHGIAANTQGILVARSDKSGMNRPVTSGRYWLYATFGGFKHELRISLVGSELIVGVRLFSV